jgi:5-methylcytosine-specific restriction endonuclease McrA
MATQVADQSSILGLENPMGTDGFEFVEYTAPDIELLRSLFTRMGFPEVARHKSKDDVQKLVAALNPQPDIASSVRKLPTSQEPTSLPLEAAVSTPKIETTSRMSTPRRSLVAPIAPERYLMRITLSDEAHRKLERARDLLRHSIPNGDPAAIVDRALTVLVEQLERTKVAATSRPHKATRTRSARSRHVPAAVKREVWTRDGGRCAFVGATGRCAATGFLEFHHVHPFTEGGATSVGNLELRCRAHNAFEEVTRAAELSGHI